MKKLILIFIVFGMINNIEAQMSLGVGGILTTPGYGVNINYNLQQPDLSNLRGKISVIQGFYKSDTYNLNYNEFVLDVGYYYNVFNNKTRTFLINTGGSGSVDYEIINKGNTVLENGDILEETGGLVFGFSVGGEAEFYLTQKLSIFLNLDQYYIFNSHISNFQTNLSGGIKMYF